MDREAVFAELRSDIAEGRTDQVPGKVTALVEEQGDMVTILSCMSILKVINDESIVPGLVEKLKTSVEGSDDLAFEAAQALRALGHATEAYGMLKTLPRTGPVDSLAARCLSDMEEHEMALDRLQTLKEPSVRDLCLMVSTLGSLGEHRKAIEASEGLLASHPKVYEVRAAYVSALLMGGRDKDAVKYIRACLKEKTADSNALAALVMRVTGNLKAAGGYATRAVQLDPKHIGGMETLGICLAQKGEIEKARIVAGAINEISPGDKAAVNVLSYCDL